LVNIRYFGRVYFDVIKNIDAPILLIDFICQLALAPVILFDNLGIALRDNFFYLIESIGNVYFEIRM
jgi:hypothetical protein